MPAFEPSVFKQGNVGVISRSGSLGTLICLKLTQAGIGQSAFIGIGGDPLIGTTTLDALQELDEDSGTEAVVMVGEIGGSMEEEAAEYARSMRKPVVAFIAGAASPAGKKMGHAGAIVTGSAGSYASSARLWRRPASSSPTRRPASRTPCNPAPVMPPLRSLADMPEGRSRRPEVDLRIFHRC